MDDSIGSRFKSLNKEKQCSNSLDSLFAQRSRSMVSIGPSSNPRLPQDSVSARQEEGPPRPGRRRAKKHRKRHLPCGPAGIWLQQQKQHPDKKPSVELVEDEEEELEDEQRPSKASKTAPANGISFYSEAWTCMQCQMGIVTPSLPPFMSADERFAILRKYMPREFLLLPEINQAKWQLEEKLLVIVKAIHSLTDDLWTAELTDETSATVRAWIQPKFVNEEQQRQQPGYLRTGLVWMVTRPTVMLVSSSEGDDGESKLDRMVLISESNIEKVWSKDDFQNKLSQDAYMKWQEKKSTVSVSFESEFKEDEDDCKPRLDSEFADDAEMEGSSNASVPLAERSRADDNGSSVARAAPEKLSQVASTAGLRNRSRSTFSPQPMNSNLQHTQSRSVHERNESTSTQENLLSDGTTEKECEASESSPSELSQVRSSSAWRPVSKQQLPPSATRSTVNPVSLSSQRTTASDYHASSSELEPSAAASQCSNVGETDEREKPAVTTSANKSESQGSEAECKDSTWDLVSSSACETHDERHQEKGSAISEQSSTGGLRETDLTSDSPEQAGAVDQSKTTETQTSSSKVFADLATATALQGSFSDGSDDDSRADPPSASKEVESAKIPQAASSFFQTMPAGLDIEDYLDDDF